MDRITQSRTFAGSHQLQKFLRFVGDAALDGSAEEIKEYTIATRVFGRGPEFDPRQDTLVRTQASRLRLRLDTYYKAEGAADEILLELPKGHYVPRFERRKPEADPGAQPGAPSPAPSPAPPADQASDFLVVQFRLPRRTAILALGGAALLLLGLFAVAWRVHAVSSPRAVASAPHPAAEFWATFLDHQTGPVVSFSDHAYLMTESSDLLRYYGDETFSKGELIAQPSQVVRDPRVLKYMGPLFFNDDFTGTGEVYAVAVIERLFTQMGAPITLTRSQLLSPAALKQQNVILIGQSAANSIAGQIGDRSVLPFDWGRGERGPFAGRVINRHPQAGERSYYEVERDPVTRALRAEYALATIMPGLAPGMRVAVLAGVSTEGTRGVVEFLASDDGITQIAARCGVPDKQGRRVLPRFFQVVLRVEIARGDIFRIQYVTSRVLTP